ncbi:MAG TPA: hypothetical protein VN810_10540 [Terriglobales bacterium]|nr:hypothetical protein [Terriglobales bacterium]
MTRRRCAVAVLLVLAVSAWTDSQPTDAKSAPPAQRQPMTQKTRLYVIRGLQSEIAFARKPFPQGTKGITLHEDGTTTPAEGQLAQEVAVIAVRPGDRVTITNIRIAKDFILFELNGGPMKKKKWHDHIGVGVEGAPTVTQTPQQTPDHSRGTLLILAFKGFVPEIAPEALKKMLYPVLDFSSKSAAEAYLDTIPPKAKEAIQNHQVLVGMDQEMVIYAKGRPLRKIRETDERGKPYEEWLYGEPPQDVEFVRFSGCEVVQLKIMKVDGQKIVRTEKEVDLKEVRQAEARKREQEATKPQPVANRPTLRRPGEEDDPAVPHRTAPATPGPIDPNETDPTLGPPRNPPPAPPPPQNPAPPGDPNATGRWVDPAFL